MIIFGNYNVLEELLNNDSADPNAGIDATNSLDPSNLVVFSLTGMREGFPTLGILPPNTILFSDDPNERISDEIMMNYIFSNDNIFFEFFSKVMYPLYSGADVYIVVTNGSVFDSITESVIKIIQQRYGYNAAYINYADDLSYIDKDTNFSLTGVYNFDIDKERYTAIGASTFGIPQTDHDETQDSLLRY